MSEHIWNNDISKYVKLESCNGCDACANRKCTEGARMTGCNHMICRDCFVNMYFGVLSDDFFWDEPVEPTKPLYPFRDEYSNLLIYRSMGFESQHKMWFIEDNEDLYNQLDIIDDHDMKAWFSKNERIKQYEESLLKYYADLLAYETKKIDFDNELYYQKRLVKNTCPACKIRKPTVSL